MKHDDMEHIVTAAKCNIDLSAAIDRWEASPEPKSETIMQVIQFHVENCTNGECCPGRQFLGLAKHMSEKLAEAQK